MGRGGERQGGAGLPRSSAFPSRVLSFGLSRSLKLAPATEPGLEARLLAG